MSLTVPPNPLCQRYNAKKETVRAFTVDVVNNVAYASQREIGHRVENAVFAVPNLSIIFIEISRSGRVFSWTWSTLICWMGLFCMERIIHILLKMSGFGRT